MRLLTVLLLTGLLAACAMDHRQDEVDEDGHSPASTARINTQLGMEYLKANDVERARSKFLTAINQAPELPEVWYGMAYFMEQTHNFEDANKYYLKALTLAPKRGDVHNNYGTFLCHTGSYQASIRQFQLAVKDTTYLTPADALENAGFCALKIPDKTLAAYYLQRATQEDAMRKNSFLALAGIYLEIGKPLTARNSLDRFLAISPPTPESRRLEGKIKTALSHGAMIQGKTHGA